MLSTFTPTTAPSAFADPAICSCHVPFLHSFCIPAFAGVSLQFAQKNTLASGSKIISRKLKQNDLVKPLSRLSHTFQAR
jgi:hypothetical protein